MHETVLLNEAVRALITKPSGSYIDGTFGRGGHSKAILKKLSPDGSLLAVDRDPEAIICARKIAEEDSRLKVYKGLFSELSTKTEAASQVEVDGILLDLGVSSPQLDRSDRGFSFTENGPLDMRMDNSEGMSAAEWLADADETEIERVLRDYGEERFARRISKAIVEARDLSPINTTGELSKIISDAHPSWEKKKHPATRSFQAIRIKINSELKELSKLLDSVLDLLVIGGRLVVISFHSLEDRLVKRFMRDMSRGVSIPKEIPIEDTFVNRRMKLLGRPIKPSKSETETNPRARSAIMRVAEKIN